MVEFEAGDRPITRVCSYCNKVIEQGDPDYVSHGICDDCFPREMEKAEEIHRQRAKEESEKQPPE